MKGCRVAVVIGFLTLGLGRAWAQAPTAPPTSPPPPPTAQPGATNAGDQAPEKATFKQEELDQMLAPIALYPDSLLSQVLMASTYPLEVVQADRWVKANKSLKGDALAKALENQDWDPSVKSLTNFPDVLAMLSDKLDWTQNLGDAFIEQQKQVMDTVQKLRGKAKEAGKLETTEQQVVKVEQQGPSQTIVIESSSPNVIYVPSYNPTVVYGTWPYPAYPPYPYYPPGYVASNVVSFGLGVACGVAWGYAWGNCNWGGGDVDIDINRNNNFNRNINRDKYRQNNMQGGRGNWQHNSEHRRGVGYRDQATAQRFGGTSAQQAAKSREAYRGRAESGRQDISKRGPEAVRNSSPATRPSTGRASPSTGARPSTGRTTTPSSRSSGGALSGVNNSGSSARASSSRGSASRSSSGASRSGGSRGGGGRRR